MLNTRRKAALGGALVGLALLALTAGSIFAQEALPPTPPGTPTHEQMDQMMESVMGAEATQQMHEMMGQGDAERGEQLMEQCVSMMGMMQNMQGMMGGQSGMMGSQGGQGMMGGMSGMMGGQGMQGMTGGQ